jgi:hypothetical protein
VFLPLQEYNSVLTAKPTLDANKGIELPQDKGIELPQDKGIELPQSIL